MMTVLPFSSPKNDSVRIRVIEARSIPHRHLSLIHRQASFRTTKGPDRTRAEEKVRIDCPVKSDHRCLQMREG